MVDIDLNELERLEKAATPGPWVWAEKNSIDFGYVGPNGERTVLFGEDHEGAVHRDDPDGKFLAALRNALPELLRRLRAAEADAERWQHQLRVDYERHSACSATSFEQFAATRNAAIDAARGRK